MILPRPHPLGSKKLNMRAFICGIVGFCSSAGFFQNLEKAGYWRLRRRLAFVIVATKITCFFTEFFLSEVVEGKQVKFLKKKLFRSNL